MPVGGKMVAGPADQHRADWTERAGRHWRRSTSTRPTRSTSSAAIAAAARRRRITNAADGATTFGKPVDNIGTKSIPQYATYANEHIYNIAIPGCARRPRCSSASARIRSSSTSARSSTWSTSPTRSGPENAEADDLADKNVTSFVLEVPIACLVQRQASRSSAAGRRRASVSDRPAMSPTPGATPCPPGTPASPKPADGPGLVWVPDQSCSGWVPSNHPAARGGRGATPPPAAAPGTQVSRLGMPLVNEVVIGLKDKDLFNSAEPTGRGARHLRHQPDAARAARDPVRRRRRARAEQLPARRPGGGVPHRHPGPEQAARPSSLPRCCG